MATEPGITPDSKDWTWVLGRACPECGFDASGCDFDQVVPLLERVAQAWADLLPIGQICSGRPNPAKWSSLEYACHVRDVFQRFDMRFQLMLTEDDPLFPNWDQDASAIEGRYDEQDPEVVIRDLLVAAEQLGTRLNGVDRTQGERRGRRSDGAAFTVESMSRYMVHDPIHHLWDVTGAGFSAQ